MLRPQGPKESGMTEQLNSISRTLIRVSSRTVNPCISLSPSILDHQPRRKAHGWSVPSSASFIRLFTCPAKSVWSSAVPIPQPGLRSYLLPPFPSWVPVPATSYESQDSGGGFLSLHSCFHILPLFKGIFWAQNPQTEGPLVVYVTTTCQPLTCAHF